MEILANLCESVLWIVFLKIFCRPKYSRKIDFPGAVSAVLRKYVIICTLII